MPRLWTPPLRELTPDTSYGYDVIRFAERVLRRTLDPWQRWLLIHGCELLPDGRPRFRTVLVEVARQNGKTEVLVILAAYWMFIARVRLVLGTSANLDYAREPLDKMVAYAESVPVLRRAVRPGWLRTNNNGVWAETRAGSRYRIAARTGRAGRSLTVDRLIADELREHRDYLAWDAAYNAMTAVPDAQAWALSNAGVPESAVLNDMRDLATEGGDPLLGYFGWTSVPTAGVDDVAAILQANPATGHRVRLDVTLAEGAAAARAGGLKLAGFRTEKMCITVATLNPAIDPQAWSDCAWAETLDGHRRRLAAFVDVAPDGEHATLAVAAVLPDERVAVEVVEAWAGQGAAFRAIRDLPALLLKVRPRVFGWAPGGPAAELSAGLAARPGWPPRGMEIVALTGDVAGACMAFRSMVQARQIRHPGDALLDAHVAGAERFELGDRWVFGRRGKGHVDAAYAAAGAVQLARQIPAPPEVRGLVVVSG